jgi:hypothetical protein
MQGALSTLPWLVVPRKFDPGRIRTMKNQGIISCYTRRSNFGYSIHAAREAHSGTSGA